MHWHKDKDRFILDLTKILIRTFKNDLLSSTLIAGHVVFLVMLGSRVGAVMRALAFHQFVPGSIPGPGVICGLSLLVLYSAPRGFYPGTQVFPSPQKPTFDLI